MSKDKLDELNPYKDAAKKYFPNGGEINTSGRRKGDKTKNTVKVTKISRNALTWAYINAISKLLNYTVPKLSSAEINDNTTKKVKIELNDDVSIDDLRAKLDEIDNN